MIDAGAHRRGQRLVVGALEDEAARGGFQSHGNWRATLWLTRSDADVVGLSHEREQGGKMPRTIGLMSGTSLDGVDAAWLETDGERVAAFGPTLTCPMTIALRRDLRDPRSRADARSRMTGA